MRPVTDLFTVKEQGLDYRWLGPVHVCPVCEFDLFHVLVRFEDRQPAFYFLDGMCARCNSIVKLPCEADE